MITSLLKDEVTYQIALKRIDELIDCPENTPDADELEIISLLVWEYEEKHYPVGQLEPIEAIKTRMEELGLKPKDLVPVIGDKSRVSEILSKKRNLTLTMIRNLHKFLHIPLETLVKEY